MTEQKRTNGIASFGSGRGNTMRIEFPEVDTSLSFIAKLERLDTYKGEFGFDWMRDNYLDKEDGTKGICENQDALKKEYTPTKIHDQDYFVPWLSMFPNQENVILKLVITEIQGSVEDTDIIKLPPKSGIIFEPNQLKVSEANGKKITIICESPLSKDITISLLDKYDKKVGMVNIVKCKDAISLPLNLVLVSESRHINKLKEKHQNTMLTLESNLQNNSFNQAFIKPYFTNDLNTAPIISLDNFSENDYNGTNLSKKGKVKILEKFKNDVVQKKGISLFLLATNHERNQAGDSQIVPLNWSNVFIYINVGTDSDYVHEIGHALGLTHSFKEGKDKVYYRNQIGEGKLNEFKTKLESQIKYLDKNLSTENRKKVNKNIEVLNKNIKKYQERFSIGDKNPYKFNKSGTTNFMDYFNDAKDFYRWQWNVMYQEVKKYYSI